MASACVNKIGRSPESFLDCPPTAKYSSFGWLSPRASFGREFQDEEKNAAGAKPEKKVDDSDPGSPANEFVDFEFRLEDPVNMLPADELFSDGKLKLNPMQLPAISAAAEAAEPPPESRRRGEVPGADPFLFSPKAPRCSSRWKELLGLKKLYQNSARPPPELHKTTPSRSLKRFLHRNSKSSSLSTSPDSSLNLPLLRDAAAVDGGESFSASSARLSLSSSSSSAASGHDHEDLPRLSLDSEKSGAATRGGANLHRLRVAKARTLSAENSAAIRAGRSPMRRAAPPPEPTTRGVSVDSPRMNASGKIVFHSLERSSSSPSSFNGGPRHKYRGMERSYSANVRVTPVLNVPVCSLRGSSKSGGVFGFPLFSSSSSSSSSTSYSSYQQRREKDSGGGANFAAVSGARGQGNGQQGSSIKSRADRN